MKIIFVLDRPDPYVHGIWFHRVQQPATALTNRGHAVRQIYIGEKVSDEILDWPDVVVFGRTYPTHLTPVKWMREFKKRGKRVIYDMDDDFWEVAKHNPSKLTSSALKDQYEGQIMEADAVITPSNVLAKKFKKYFKKKVFICPNGVDLTKYVERPHNPKPGDQLVIGYMGASSHWKDLHVITDVIVKLYEKYKFIFAIYGIVGTPIDAYMYYTKQIIAHNFEPEKREEHKATIDFYTKMGDVPIKHIPFYPPELHPSVMGSVDFDIGLAPLEDTTFNRGKSCVKYYEYASVGTPVLASDVLPYSEEVSYRAKNTFKDWYNKLEKLIIDEKFRKELIEKQQKWVKENRSLEAIALPWELALQRDGIKGLTVASQR